MIDRNARNKLVKAMRTLASDLITSNEFEDHRLPSSKEDMAIFEVFSEGARHLYSDFKEYRLAGIHRLDKETKNTIARWILFLKTDHPHEWPVSTRKQASLRLLANFFTLSMANRYFIHKYRACGDVEAWPFFRRTDYEATLQKPVYLNNAL